MIRRNFGIIDLLPPGKRADSPSSAWRFAILSGLLILAAGCADGEPEDPAIARGAELYEANCASCHGAGALGDGDLASTLPVAPPSLMDHLGHHTEAQLIQLIKSGVPPAMPPTPLSDEDIGLIVDYLWTLVPEGDVEELRQMQQHMEMMEDSAGSAMSGMPGMEAMPGADSAAAHMQH